MVICYTNEPGNKTKPTPYEKTFLPADAEVLVATWSDTGDNEDFYNKIARADVILNSYVYFGKDLLDRIPNCKCISFQSTGYNEVDLEYAAEKGIAVCSILDYCTQETAENAIASMMALQRTIVGYNELVQKKHIWNVKAIMHQQRIEGQTIGIVGLGRIGRHVAKIAGAGLGMKVLAYDPYIPASLAVSVNATLVDFDTLLAESDVVSCHMALTEENKYMFNKETFLKMKKHPIFINEGRGQMVSEKDLAWALDEGIVRAAGLDMLESESPDADYLKNSPLVGRDNVIICPHSGYQSDTSLDLIFSISVDNAIKCFEGRYQEAAVVRNGVGIGGKYIR